MTAFLFEPKKPKEGRPLVLVTFTIVSLPFLFLSFYPPKCLRKEEEENWVENSSMALYSSISKQRPPDMSS